MDSLSHHGRGLASLKVNAIEILHSDYLGPGPLPV